MRKYDVKYLLGIISKSIELFESEPILLIEDSIKEAIIVGDIHGDSEALQRIIEIVSRQKNPVIFLGDYVDRGENSLEVITSLLELKIREPERIFLLRGNHELKDINEVYGFRSELLRRFSDGLILYEEFNDLFSKLPIAMVIDGNVLLLHGGIPIGDYTLNDFAKIPKGIKTSYENDLLLQILWNDPFEGKGYLPSMRGPGIWLFGLDIFQRFMNKSKLSLLIRGHQFFPMGYKYFFNGKLLSLFSTVNYVGRPVKGKIAKYHRGEISLIDLT